jgi:hypothetical protein
MALLHGVGNTPSLISDQVLTILQIVTWNDATKALTNSVVTFCRSFRPANSCVPKKSTGNGNNKKLNVMHSTLRNKGKRSRMRPHPCAIKGKEFQGTNN